ncbi:MAG: sugar phosphate nucleotidyltransferase [Candidatus Njordarchaeia archaeon]
MLIKKAIIPAAGYGTRLLPITKILPKPLVPLLQKPTLMCIIEELISAGIQEALVIVGWKEELVKEFFEHVENELTDWLKQRGATEILESVQSPVKGEITLQYRKQEVLNGLGGAILLGENFVNDHPFVVPLGDNIIIERKKGSLIRDMISIHNSFNADVTLCVAPVPAEQVSRFGVIGVKEESKLNGIRVLEVDDLKEKPKIEDAPSNLAIVGRYILSPIALKYLKEAPLIHGEISETDAFKNMINDGKKVVAVEIGNRRWYDVGSPDGYVKAMIEIALTEYKNKEKIKIWLENLLSKYY